MKWCRDNRGSKSDDDNFTSDRFWRRAAYRNRSRAFPVAVGPHRRRERAGCNRGRDRERRDALGPGSVLRCGTPARRMAYEQLCPAPRHHHHRFIAATGSCRASGRFRHATRERLHQRSRRVRRGATFAAIGGRDSGLHGGRHCDSVRVAPSVGGLIMRAMLTALMVGVLFGAGLALSDMINPGRVLAFLDVAGHWDPTLAFVMAGALVPTAAAFALRPQLRKPVFGTEFFIPENHSTDRKLMLGSAVFGLGWGLVGFCPGPAIAALSSSLW